MGEKISVTLETNHVFGSVTELDLKTRKFDCATEVFTVLKTSRGLGHKLVD